MAGTPVKDVAINALITSGIAFFISPPSFEVAAYLLNTINLAALVS